MTVGIDNLMRMADNEFQTFKTVDNKLHQSWEKLQGIILLNNYYLHYYRHQLMLLNYIDVS